MLSWQSGNDFVKRDPSGAQTSRETIPITAWHSGESPVSTSYRKISGNWYKFKERFQNPNSEPPEGWTRRGTPPGNTRWVYPDHPPPEGYGSYYFTYRSWSQLQLWYPIPVHEEETIPTLQQPAQSLFASVEIATFYTRAIRVGFHTPSVNIENHTGEWAGVVRPHRSSEISENVGPKM
jgi:hypothetical protein